MLIALQCSYQHIEDKLTLSGKMLLLDFEMLVVYFFPCFERVYEMMPVYIDVVDLSNG